MEVEQLRKKDLKRPVLFAVLIGLIIALIAFIVIPEVSWKSRNLNRTIFLSPSVQYGNKYAWGDTNEGEMMQSLCDEVEILLKAEGFPVYRNDSEKTLEDAVNLSNRKKAGVHVAMHSNAVDNSTARGCEVYIPKADNAKSKRLGEKLIKQITDVGTKSRGVKETSSLYEINKSEADAVALIEIDFHDNVDGAKWIIDNKSDIAKAICDGILNYYK